MYYYSRYRYRRKPFYKRRFSKYYKRDYKKKYVAKAKELKRQQKLERKAKWSAFKGKLLRLKTKLFIKK